MRRVLLNVSDYFFVVAGHCCTSPKFRRFSTRYRCARSV
jgi:hypothetical protein